jgi:hypothetical protein
MPPINQQGSRAGLVTALVVFVILFVVSAVFAFSYYGQVKKLTLDSDSYRKQYNGFLSDAAIASPQVQALVAAKSEQPPHFGVTPSETAMDVALKQTAGLSAVITGATTDQPAGTTADAAAAALKGASAQLATAKVKLDLTAGGLDGAVSRLASKVAADQQTIADLNGQLAAANDNVTKLTASVADVNNAKDQAAKAQHDADAQAAAQAQKSSDDSAAAVKQIQADEDAAVKKNADAQQQVLSQVADAQHQLQVAQVDNQKLEARLANRRPDVTNATVRVPDGELIRVPGGGVCYINLGYGTGVSNGLTFEVYDKISGVPPIPPNVTGDEQLPVGKASIEIIHVGDNSSECRIVHTEPGAVLTEGDPIENLVYDAHQKYQFDVFGSFDLANTGHPNTADAEVIKRLVTQWGGKLTDRISPDTDFLVLGSEPVLPEFAKDDLTPENQDKLQKAQEALDQYQEVSKEARDLHIPVLNQNRFLYYVGYYDQATR